MVCNRELFSLTLFTSLVLIVCTVVFFIFFHLLQSPKGFLWVTVLPEKGKNCYLQVGAISFSSVIVLLCHLPGYQPIPVYFTFICPFIANNGFLNTSSPSFFKIISLSIKIDELFPAFLLSLSFPSAVSANILQHSGVVLASVVGQSLLIQALHFLCRSWCGFMLADLDPFVLKCQVKRAGQKLLTGLWEKCKRLKKSFKKIFSELTFKKYTYIVITPFFSSLLKKKKNSR